MATTKFCQGISDISDTYMGFIIDQWGVLHDGQTPYDGVVDCLQELKKRHKTVVILSNSPLPEAQTRDKLLQIGIAPEMYDHIVTSGEMVHDGVIHQEKGLFKHYGKSCYVFGHKEAKDVFDGTKITVCETVSEADFLLIAGVEAELKGLEDYLPLLKEAVRKGLKAICINPDSHALLGASYLIGPGLIARKYEEIGGVVQYIGKPHAPIFRRCIELLQSHDVFPAQTVMVGDTMAHDIMGAHYVNIDTCLVKTGIHAGVFKNCTTPAEVDRTLDILITHYNHIRPRYLVDRLMWGKSLPDRKHKIHKKHVRRKPAVVKGDESDVSGKPQKKQS
ncbi:MAG: TIGR01459 family HAD-type hydrolase [Rhodospirillales bacterium]|nr:TIGR01459 family HAD-type hydrolase [Rhodospirillales bacterium]MCB9965005.1 TIGR01459 family HAD-type hydrolase [Rhodospirillales bacterium]MCB9973403.1 TIGR01459 family HAD-type hydrolase [Rhodospirillales bacterium]MCB9980406.1 TIGR01459 family HAD-type hydrolase [Rhodospirillales bacterium]